MVEPKLGDQIPEDWLKNAEKEIKSKYRTLILDDFREKKDVEVHIFQLTSGDESIAADAYTRSFSKFMKDPDLMTRKQMLKAMNIKEAWGEVEEEAINDFHDRMRDIQLTVAKLRQRAAASKRKVNKAQLNKLRKQWLDTRQALLDLANEKSEFLSRTVEGRSEEEEIKAKMSLCVKFPDGKLVWNSINELNGEFDVGSVRRICNDAMLFWSGLTQEIISDLPVRMIFDGEDESENSQDH